MTSYQKLKAKVSELEKQLDTIAENPRSMKSIEIIMDRRMRIEMCRVLWFGSPDNTYELHGVFKKND